MCGAVRKGLTRGPGSRGLSPSSPSRLVPSAPFVEKGARNPEKPTRREDIATDLLTGLKHAQAGRCALGPLAVANDSLHPGPPFATTLARVL
jgi:hypothetical protein